jgi:endonuclease-3
VRAVHAALRGHFGPRRWRRDGAAPTILDSLVGTILSQNTSDTNSDRAFEALKARFPTWDAVREAPARTLERAIRSGGLARIKARRIRAILNQVHRAHGATSLEHLRRAEDEVIRSTLRGFTGVGPKTVACVLLFDLGRPDFPVDTHVHRIARRLGWVGPRASAEETYDHLRPRIPAPLCYELHVDLVRLGREVCQSRRARCEECPLRRLCDTGRAVR